MLAGLRQIRGRRSLELTGRPAAPGCITMLKTLFIATVLLRGSPSRSNSQLPQPRQPSQLCPVGWMGERLPQLRLNDGPSRERPRRHGQLRPDGGNGIDVDVRTSAIASAAWRAWAAFSAIRSR